MILEASRVIVLIIKRNGFFTCDPIQDACATQACWAFGCVPQSERFGTERAQTADPGDCVIIAKIQTRLKQKLNSK
jgi:hypothetical protein